MAGRTPVPDTAPAPAPERRRAPPITPAGEPARTVPVWLDGEPVDVPLAAGPDGALRGDVTGLGIRRGGVLLTDVVADAEGVWAAGAVDAPFVTGTARLALDAAGRPSGRLAMDAAVALAGVPLARIGYAEDAWPGDALPVPSVAVEGDTARVTVPDVLVRGRMEVDTGTGPQVTGAVSLRLPLTGPASDPDVAASEGRPIDPAIAARVAEILRQPPGPLTVHTDEPAGAAARRLGVPGFTRGRDLYFDRGRYDPAVAAGLELLLRLVGQAITGTAEVPDPDAEDVVPQQPVAAPAPEAPAEPAAEPVAPETVLPVAEAAPEGVAAPPAEGAPAPEEVAAEGAGAEEEAAPQVELLMPPAPAEPTPPQQARMAAAGGAARSAAGSAGTLPDAGQATGEAREAVTIPDAEAAARAEAELAEELGARAEPSPEIVELCDDIRAAIRAKRPVDEDELVDTDMRETAQEAGASMSTAVEGDANRVRESYDELQQDPAAPAPPEGAPLVPPEPAVADPGIDAPSAAPDAIPPEDVSLDADAAAVDQQIADANIERVSTEPINEPPFTTVREGRAELGEMAATSPAEVLAQQDAALGEARAGMAQLQAQALATLRASRGTTVTGSTTQQSGMVTSEEQTRESVSREAQGIFDAAQQSVDTMLRPLAQNAMRVWDEGVERASIEFRQHLDEVKEWIDERHSGVGGTIVAGWDALTGLPDWVTEEYDDAERLFGDRVCELLLEISADVNSVVAAAEAVIEDARTRIDTLFADLPADLQAWAQEQRAQFAERLDGLHQRVVQTRDDFNRDLGQRAVQAVAEVQREVEALREAARGVLGRIADAIGEFLDDPVRAIINGLLSLVGIPPAAFWALVERIAQVISAIADDPMSFVNNLVEALKQGFQAFFDNFPQHLVRGFFDWLFSALGSVGVQIPTDFSLTSIITFALQLMGITWPRIREILVRHVGERNVALVEQAWTLVSTLIQQGPAGVFEMLRERLDPAALLQQILDAAVQYVVQAVVERVAARILLMMNPAGAVVQAIELIYRILKWVFENAARIFRFVETVVNGMADIVAGNIAGTAAAIEQALASLLPPVIDFLAGFLGFGDLPEKVADVIKGLQAYVYGILESVIGFLAERGRALLASLGLGGGPTGGAAGPGGDTELGRSVSFSGGGESHRQWVAVAGSQATLMVASDTPMPVAERLTQWAGRVGELAEGQRPEATGLIARARTLLGIADAAADQLAPAYAAAAQGAAPAPAATAATAPAAGPPSDDVLEAKQQEITTVLARLFELFGEQDAAANLAGIAQHMPAHGRAHAGESVHPFWNRVYLGSVEFAVASGNEITHRKLWSQSDLGSTSAGDQAMRDAGLHTQLTAYYTGDVRRRTTPESGAFREWALTGSPAPARVPLLTALGNAAIAALRTSGLQKINTTEGLEDSYRQEWRDRLNDPALMSFDVGTGPYGQLGLPVERVREHSFFRPENVSFVDRNGTRTTTYTTKAGQRFTVRRDSTSGLTTQAKGFALRIQTGRGVTEDSPGFIRNQNLNRAHLIANQFGGSGYKDSDNLATTSAHYNQRIMTVAERFIVGRLTAWANTREPPVPIDAVTFDLTVDVTYGELLDQTVLDEIRTADWYKGDGNVEQEINDKIAAATGTPLKRVMLVRYRATVTGGGAGSVITTQTNPPVDIWLLITF